MRQSGSNLTALGRDLNRLRRRSRRLSGIDWTSWSATVDEANTLARRISGMQPRSLEELLIRYNALHWQLVESDDVIVDKQAKRAFVAFGRALKRMMPER